MERKTTITNHIIDLNILFPFFFRMGSGLSITEAGCSLRKLFPGIEGKSLTEVFQIKGVESTTLRYETLPCIDSGPVSLQAIENNTLFKGHFSRSANTDEILFLGNLCIPSAHTVDELGLSIDDFAVHDTLASTSQLMNSQEKDNYEIKTKAENIYKHSNLLNKIIDLVPHQIFLKDSQSRFLLVNKRMSELFGADVVEIIGKTDKDFWGEKEEVDFYMDIEKKVMETGQTFEIPEEPQTRKNGQKCFNRVIKMPFTMENGDKCVLGIAIDITDIKEAEQKLKSYNEDLETQIKWHTRELSDKNKELIRYSNQLEQYAFTVSHNLRAPVATLLGLTSILNVEKPEDPGNKRVLSKITDCSNLLNEVIRDLNRMIDIKKGLDVLMPVDLSQVIKKMENIFYAELQSIGAVLETDINTSPFYSNGLYIESVFYNLISNAIKFRSHNRPLRINIRAGMHENVVNITVADNGSGMDLDRVKDKIFGLYQRFHTHIKGRGLGLHMVKEQIEALEGKIEVKSNENEGSAFFVKLSVTSPQPDPSFQSVYPEIRKLVIPVKQSYKVA